MIALLLANWRVLAAVGIAALVFGAGWSVNGSRWEARYNIMETEYANARADANRKAREVLEEAVLRERAEQRRLEDEAAAATLAAEERAEGLADRLAKTQAALKNALKTDSECAAWAAQPIACPVSSH